MSLVPSKELADEISRCPDCHPVEVGGLTREGLCPRHRSRWNLEACTAESESTELAGGYLERLVQRAIASEHTGSSFLSALETQARALDVIWEAHRRGAAQLPPKVAATLERARSAVPGFLAGGTLELDSPREEHVVR